MKRFLGMLVMVFAVQSVSGQDLRPARNFDGTYGYIDGSGTFVIGPSFLEAYEFHEGFARVKRPGDGRTVFIDQKGKSPFEHYPLSVSISKDTVTSTDADNLIADIQGDFSSGLARVRYVKFGASWRQKELALGYVDTRGNLALDASSYLETTDFVDGVAVVVGDTRKPSLIGKDGRVLSTGVIEELGPISDGMISVRYAGSRYFGYISTKGEPIIPPSFRVARPFRFGSAVVVDQAGNVTYIDKKGRTAGTTQVIVERLLGNKYKLDSSVDVRLMDSVAGNRVYIIATRTGNRGSLGRPVLFLEKPDGSVIDIPGAEAFDSYNGGIPFNTLFDGGTGVWFITGRDSTFIDADGLRHDTKGHYPIARTFDSVSPKMESDTSNSQVAIIGDSIRFFGNPTESVFYGGVAKVIDINKRVSFVRTSFDEVFSE